MSVAHVVALGRLEVCIEATFVFAHCQVAVPRIHVFVYTGAGGIFPLGLGRQTVRLYIHALFTERPAKEVCAPVGEGIGLLPAHAHYRIVVISAMREIHAHVWLIVGVLEVVDPCGCIGIHIHNIGIEEVVRSGKAARDSLTTNLTLFIHPCGILGNSGVYTLHVAAVGIVVAAVRLKAVAATCSLGMVVDFVAVVELRMVKLARTGDGVGAVDAFYRTLLVFIGVAPWYGLVPVEMGSHGVTLAVFLDLEVFVASVGRVGKTLADNTVAHPEYKLLVFAVGNLGLIHPEAVYADSAGIGLKIPEGVVFIDAHFHRATVYQNHTVWGRLGPRCTADTRDFAACRPARSAGSTRRQCCHQCQGYKYVA